MAVSLSQGMRNAVYSLGDINDSIALSNKRLATGKKVNSALDNAGAFFRAQGLNKDARDLGGLLDGMERGQKIIAKAASAINGMIKLVESAQALSRQAVQLADTDANRTVLQTQIAGLLTQANQLAQDATYDGKNILTTGTTAQTNETINSNVSGSTSVVLTAQNVRIGTLAAGFTAAATGISFTPTANAESNGVGASWLTAAGTTLINTTITQFNTVLTGLQTAASNVATQSAVLDIRKSFTKDAQRANNEFADYLTLADINEEGANLTSLQTKQSLAVTSLSLAGRADQAILRLF
jgi:flagellin